MNTRPEHDDLKPLAPTLASIPKVEPFVVPEGLFERFPHQVQARVTGQPPGLRRSPWVRRLALALPLLAVLAGTWWVLHDGSTPNVQLAVAIPETTVDQLLLIDEPDAFAALVEGASDLPPDVSVDLTDAELIAWLETEQTDLAQLITEP